jgi:hypothetical protein
MSLDSIRSTKCVTLISALRWRFHEAAVFVRALSVKIQTGTNSCLRAMFVWSDSDERDKSPHVGLWLRLLKNSLPGSIEVDL